MPYKADIYFFWSCVSDLINSYSTYSHIFDIVQYILFSSVLQFTTTSLAEKYLIHVVHYCTGNLVSPSFGVGQVAHSGYIKHPV